MTSIALVPSSGNWLQCVLDDFSTFLIDHAANERKASAMAMSMVAHYPDRTALVSEMVDLALEELQHFRQVLRLIHARNLIMTPDEKDPYVNRLRGHVSVKQPGAETDLYFLDRLLCAAVIEARGEERFRQIAAGLKDSDLQAFYAALANSEQGHHRLFIRLAETYFDADEVAARLDRWIALETGVISTLPARPRLH